MYFTSCSGYKNPKSFYFVFWMSILLNISRGMKLESYLMIGTICLIVLSFPLTWFLAKIKVYPILKDETALGVAGGMTFKLFLILLFIFIFFDYIQIGVLILYLFFRAIADLLQDLFSYLWEILLQFHDYLTTNGILSTEESNISQIICSVALLILIVWKYWHSYKQKLKKFKWQEEREKQKAKQLQL